MASRSAQHLDRGEQIVHAASKDGEEQQNTNWLQVRDTRIPQGVGPTGSADAAGAIIANGWGVVTNFYSDKSSAGAESPVENCVNSGKPKRVEPWAILSQAPSDGEGAETIPKGSRAVA